MDVAIPADGLPTDDVPMPPPSFVPREAEYAELQRHFDAVHGLEAERKRLELLRTVVPWGLAGVFAVYAAIAGLQTINRPAPRDRFEVTFIHDDGTSETAEEPNLTPEQRSVTLRTSLVNFITWRFGYSFASSQKAYTIVSGMTAGNEQSRYQMTMLSRSDPSSPLVKYGLAGQLVPLDIHLDQDPNGPNSWDFSFTMREIVRDAPPRDVPMRGSMTFVRGKVPMSVRVPYDPASIVVLQSEAHEVPR